MPRTKPKRMTQAQLCATIIDRTSYYYGYVGATWGREWAESCRTLQLLLNLNLGEPLSNKGEPGQWAGNFPDLMPEAQMLAAAQGLTNVRLGANKTKFHVVTDQGIYYLLNTDVRYANGGREVSYHGDFHLVRDPS